MMNDTIYRQAAIEAMGKAEWAKERLRELPSAESEPVIPLSWIEAQIEWLKSLDNAFTTLTAAQISSMVKKWKDEQDE